MSKYQIETVDRAIGLLLTMAELDTPVRLRDLTDQLGWNKTTTYRLVKTLERRGVLLEVGTQGYVLGPSLVALGQAASEDLNVSVVARPYLQTLHDQLHETVNLGALAGRDAVILARIEDKSIFGLRLKAGSSVPAYCTSMGLVLLSGLEDEEIQDRFPDGDLKPRGPRSVASTDELLNRVREIRTLGYAINDQELAAGHLALAVPIHDHNGSIPAAINVSLPSARISRDELEESFLPQLQTTAARISAAMGAPVPADSATDSPDTRSRT